MELKDYTTEELREELKRRNREARRIANRSEPEYKEFTGIVRYINRHTHGSNSYCFEVRSAVVGGVPTDDFHYNRSFKLKQGVFKKDTMPKIGDKVLLRYKRTKVNKRAECFDIHNAKIIKILEYGNS